MFTNRLTAIDDWREHWQGLVMIEPALSRFSALSPRTTVHPRWHVICHASHRCVSCITWPIYASLLLHALTLSQSLSTVPILITQICWVSKMPLSHNSQTGDNKPETGCTCTVYPCPPKLLRQFFLYSFGLYLFIFLFCIFLLLFSFNLFFSLFFFNSLCVSSLLQIKTSNKKSLSKRNQNQNVGLISVITCKSK